jgi:cell wall-associated NlpC family hydrolase
MTTEFANTYKTDPAEPITHVGIYLGDGWMLNAPREGATVQAMPVFTGFWGAHYAGAGRVRGARVPDARRG